MTMRSVDLHNHTPLFADYRGPLSTSPADIVRTAQAAGVDLLAVTDHLSVEYFPLLEAEVERSRDANGGRLWLLPGVEFRISAEGVEAHLVVLLPSDDLAERVAELFRRVAFSPDDVSRVEIPSLLLPRDPQQVAEAAVAVGGVVHLAHVDRYFGATRLLDSPLFDRLARDAPIAGVDIVDPVNVPEVARRAPGLALLHSSDSHALAEIGRRVTRLDLPEGTLCALQEALRRHARLTVAEAVATFAGTCSTGDVREAGHPGVVDPAC